MYRLRLAEARIVAKDFVKRCDACLQLDPNNDFKSSLPKIQRSKESGAVIRASMELTRKLSELRGNK
jgi:hypothetical protein